MSKRRVRLVSPRPGAILPSCLLVAALVGAAGCSGSPEPVARVGIEAGDIVLPHGGWVELEVSWFPLRPLRAPDVEPVVFVHLTNSSGTLVRTFDDPYPHDWVPGVERMQTIHLSQSALAPPLEPGTYSLTLGLWDPASGSRWPLQTEAGAVGRFEYPVAAVEVPSRSQGISLSVAGEVLESEAGVDLQVLTRTDLAGPAEVRVEGVASPGVMLLELTIDAVAPLAAGSAPGTVAISGSCGCRSMVVTELGPSRLALPLAPDGGAGSCLVRLEPDDPMLIAMAVGRRRVAITALAWRNQP